MGYYIIQIESSRTAVQTHIEEINLYLGTSSSNSQKS